MAASASQKPDQTTRRQKLEAREAAILEAATTIFVQKGVDGSRMQDIAAAADIAEGTLYLYYRNKQALLNGVVGHFWHQLTLGAEAAIDAEASAAKQFRQLAEYHLRSLLEQYEVVDLTYRARRSHGEPEQQLEQIREYVRVFNSVYQRACDRQELDDSTPRWQRRDVFYGSLEHAARTLHLRGEDYDPGVVDTVVGTIMPKAMTSASGGTAKDRHSNTRDLETRLDNIERLLAQLIENPKA